ncbi:hypothetical protein [Aurantiacibacter rhizosphaerae]|uniref:hypothetical protein n=1 Tax=Aurantiacibacter rhizosphaerae TaxID=2691582 RepID=UPI0019212F0B|nr:hypothetical protein [Aurantiacibacter rhizosphaerae]
MIAHDGKAVFGEAAAQFAGNFLTRAGKRYGGDRIDDGVPYMGSTNRASAGKMLGPPLPIGLGVE